MAYEDIYSRYKKMYESQNNSLAQKKDSAIQSYQNQQRDITNQYADIANSLKSRREGVKTQYGNLYRGLDQQNVQAKNQNYSDRNNVDVAVNQNLNRIQELMAKNGWSGGGENLQAQLNSNSDRSNGFGEADTTMGNTMNTILNNRNQYLGEEQSANNEIDNQVTSSEREKVSKIQAIMDAISSANTNYSADSNALKAGLDAQAEAEVYQAEQVAKERAYNAQQEALAYSRQVALQQSKAKATAAKKSNNSNNPKTTTAATNNALAEVNTIVSNSGYNYDDRINSLNNMKQSLSGQQGEQSAYMKAYIDKAIKEITQQKSNFINSGRYAGYGG